jgi:hypothetical protein
MGRITGRAVAPLHPSDPAARVHTVLVGEAPGPRGADQSGIPFLGDRAGVPLYAALEAAGCIRWHGDPRAVPWDGAALRDAGVRPEAIGVWLTNAFDRCPTDDGEKFRAPTAKERTAPANLARLGADLDAARARGAVQVCCLGRVAGDVVSRLSPPMTVHVLPHPSAQGLLMAAPGKGKGMALATLEAEWTARLVALLRGAATMSTF